MKKEHGNKGIKRPDLSARNILNIVEKIELICECGKYFFVIPSRIKHRAKYCSQKCYHKYTKHNNSQGKNWKLSEETKIKQSLSQVGDKNHNWKGGVGPRARMRYLRKSVIERDNCMCVCCGTKGKKNYRNKNYRGLVAHHIEAYNSNVELRQEINNLITLCKKCHKDFHKKYGYGNNTLDQFNEWLNSFFIKIDDIKLENVSNISVYNISLDGDSSFFANGILTHNTLPHIIKPKNKKALSWKGAKHPMKMIKHPGNRPNPFIRTTLRQKLPNIISKHLRANL